LKDHIYMAKLPRPAASPSQPSLALTIAKEMEVDGVGMGVLSDGTAYLTETGLARLCGIRRSVLFQLSEDWSDPEPKPRVAKIKQTLAQQGLVLDRPYLPISVSGSQHNAYPESICMAALEYYAFDASQGDNTDALRNYRSLARRSFRDFIYAQTGYSPSNAIPQAWQQFHDRVSLSYARVPDGYFSIFKELSDVIVTLIQGGANVGAGFIPDISVGIRWARHWEEAGLKALHGDRMRYPHSYPSYFPQSASNPQPAYCYPDECLPAFRRWMREAYLPSALPAYLNSKVRQGALPATLADMSIKAIETRSLPIK
jgi:hypothetical protein